MAEKMTGFWLILLTMITCISVPVLLVILTAPHPTQLILAIDEKFLDLQPYNEINKFPFI
jgi:hypothetical protein